MSTVSDMTPTSDVSLTGPMALQDTKDAWLADAEEAIDRLARSGRTFTADDVRALIGAPEHGNWWGIAFAKARNSKVIQSVAFSVARSKSRNGGSLRVWRAAE